MGGTVALLGDTSPETIVIHPVTIQIHLESTSFPLFREHRLAAQARAVYSRLMDPVTHLTTGALAGRFLAPRMGTRWTYALCVLAAWLPDIDNFVGLSPEDYLLHHRGLTHSLVGIGAQALLLALVFRFVHKAFTPLKTFCIALALLAAHVWLDVVTTYGTQVLAPFNTTRYHWGSVFIIDLLLTLGGMGFFIAAVRNKHNGARIAGIGLTLMLLYPLACQSVRDTVESSMPSVLAERAVAYDELRVTTDAFSPFYWKLVLTDGDTLRVGSVSVLPALQHDFNFATLHRADPHLLDRLGREASFFATWDWFAQWPVMEEHPTTQGRNVTFRDARFLSRQPLVRRWMGARDLPFSITAHLDAAGGLTGFSYNNHGKIITYAVTN